MMDPVHGNWSGMIGFVMTLIIARKSLIFSILKLQIERDEADVAIGNFMFDRARCSVVQCCECNYQPFYFNSKYPERADPIWNLVRLFPPMIWMYIWLCISGIVLFFAISSKCYTKMGFKKNLIQEEIEIVPIRQFMIIFMCLQVFLMSEYFTFQGKIV